MASVRPKFPSVSNINGLTVVTDGTLPLLCPAQGFPVPNHRYVMITEASFSLENWGPSFFLRIRIISCSKERSFIFNPFVTAIYNRSPRIVDTIGVVVRRASFSGNVACCFCRVSFSRDSAEDLSRVLCTFLHEKSPVAKGLRRVAAYFFSRSSLGN